VAHRGVDVSKESNKIVIFSIIVALITLALCYAGHVEHLQSSLR